MDNEHYNAEDLFTDGHFMRSFCLSFTLHHINVSPLNDTARDV